MAKRERVWWRLVEPREFPAWEGEGPQFAWCGHVFYEGWVVRLWPEVIEIDVRRMAEDDAGRRSVDATMGDLVAIPKEAFPGNGIGFDVGDHIILHHQCLPDSVRTAVGRMRPGMRRNRERERAWQLDLLEDWGEEPLSPARPPEPRRRAYPEDPQRATNEELRLQHLALMRFPVACLFDPPHRRHALFSQPTAYLKGMRVVDPAEFAAEAFQAVGRSDYSPRPGALLDVRSFFLEEGAYPSDDLRRCGVPQDQAYVVRIPFVEAIEAVDPRVLSDPIYREMVLEDARYRVTIPGFLFTNDRPTGSERGTLTRLWVPRPEGGSFCHVKAEWLPGGLDL